MSLFFLVSSREGTVFGGISEERCSAMRSMEDLAQMGLNQSQIDAVSSLVQCPHGVQLVQGPPGEMCGLPVCNLKWKINENYGKARSSVSSSKCHIFIAYQG